MVQFIQILLYHTRKNSIRVHQFLLFCSLLLERQADILFGSLPKLSEKHLHLGSRQAPTALPTNLLPSGVHFKMIGSPFSQVLFFFLTCSLNKVDIIKMLKVLSSQQRIDIFSKNCHGYIVHEWSCLPAEDNFLYQVVAKDAVGRPTMACVDDWVHLYYVNRQKELQHVQLNLLEPHSLSHKVVASNVCGDVSPTCIDFGHHIYLYFVDQEGKLVEAHHSISSSQELHLRYIDQRRGEKAMLRAVRTGKGDVLVFYKKIKSLYWFSLKKSFPKAPIHHFFQLPFSTHSTQTFEVFSKKGLLHLLIPNQDANIHELTLDESEENMTYLKQLSRVKVLPGSSLSVFEGKRSISIWFASKKQEISQYQNNFETEEESLNRYEVDDPIGTFSTVVRIRQKLKLFFLDENGVLARFGGVRKGGKIEYFSQLNYLPYLNWEDLRPSSKPLGTGYFSEVFYVPQLEKAVKRFKKEDYASKAQKQIIIQQKLNQIEVNRVSHRLFEKGILRGFSLPLIKGRKWHDILENRESLIHKSSIARVKLVISLAEHIRRIQSINLCHGDIHIGNILMNIEENGQLLEPNVWAKVIDFGNSFQMEPGRLVSVGRINGDRNIVPPEIKACNQTNYNPYGYNPYQLAVNTLLILLREKFSWAFLAEKKIKRLDRMLDQYPPEIKAWVSQLIHKDVKRRCKALNSDIRHFSELTRTLLEKKIEKEEAEPNTARETKYISKPSVFSISPKRKSLSPQRKTLLKTAKANNITQKYIPRQKTLQKVELVEKLELRPPVLLPVTPRLLQKGARTAQIGRRLSLKG